MHDMSEAKLTQTEIPLKRWTDEELFFGTSGPLNASILIVGEGWGPAEEMAKAPFVGSSGQFFREMLKEAGINPDLCFLTNMTPRKPDNNDTRLFFHRIDEKMPTLKGLHPKKELRDDLEKLYAQIERVQPRVVVAVGAYAFWALTRGRTGVATEKGYKVPSGVGTWRGSFLTYDEGGDKAERDRIPLVPIYHPAGIIKNYAWRQVTVQDLRGRVAPLGRGGQVPSDHRDIITAPTLEQTLNVLSYLSQLGTGHTICCDVETRSPHIDCIGLSWSKTRAICIPFISVFSGNTYWEREDEFTVRKALVSLFKRGDLFWSNQNISYDLQYLDLWLYQPPRPQFDTMVAHHLLYPGTPKSLDYLASLYCDYYRYWGESTHHTTDQQRWWYNGLDCCYTYELTEELRVLVQRSGKQELFQERMDLLWEVALPMMREGVRIDLTERKKQALKLYMEMEKFAFYFKSVMPLRLRQAVRGPSSKSEWFDSPIQQMVLFYDIMNLTEHYNTKTKKRTVDDDALPKIAAEEPLLRGIIDLLQHYRSMRVYYTNFMTAPVDWDNRMRSSLDICGTETFRWASRESAFNTGANLMNIPKEKQLT